MTRRSRSTLVASERLLHDGRRARVERGRRAACRGRRDQQRLQPGGLRSRVVGRGPHRRHRARCDASRALRTSGVVGLAITVSVALRALQRLRAKTPKLGGFKTGAPLPFDRSQFAVFPIVP